MFGQGFENCAVNGSRIIAKYNYDDGVFQNREINSSAYPSIDGTEFTINLGDNTWSYSPGANDPGVRYWVAKGGNQGFNLLYVVPDALDGACGGNGLSASCLDAAVSQTFGSFATPTGQALSHISFYNGAASVPEPVRSRYCPSGSWHCGCCAAARPDPSRGAAEPPRRGRLSSHQPGHGQGRTVDRRGRV